MKSIRLMLATALAATAVSASAQYAMEMTHNDGRVETIPFTQIDEMTFDLLQEGVDYVDLGLPSGTLWATTNVGTSDPNETGLMFVWGMTAPFDYTRNQRTNNTMSFAQMVERGIIDSEGYLIPDHDPATLYKGALYRTPTNADWEELGINCDREYLSSGHPDYPWLTSNAIEFTGPNGNKLVIVNAENYRWISNNNYTHWTTTSLYAFYLVANRQIGGSYIFAQIQDVEGSPGERYGLALYNAEQRAVNIRPVLTVKNTPNE